MYYFIVPTYTIEKNTQIYFWCARACPQSTENINDLHVDHYHIVTQGHCFSSSSSRRTPPHVTAAAAAAAAAARRRTPTLAATRRRHRRTAAIAIAAALAAPPSPRRGEVYLLSFVSLLRRAATL